MLKQDFKVPDISLEDKEISCEDYKNKLVEDEMMFMKQQKEDFFKNFEL